MELYHCSGNRVSYFYAAPKRRIKTKRNDNAAENIDILRQLALNAVRQCKQKPDELIKSIMRKNSMSFKHLLETLKKIFHTQALEFLS